MVIQDEERDIHDIIKPNRSLQDMLNLISMYVHPITDKYKRIKAKSSNIALSYKFGTTNNTTIADEIFEITLKISPVREAGLLADVYRFILEINIVCIYSLTVEQPRHMLKYDTLDELLTGFKECLDLLYAGIYNNVSRKVLYDNFMNWYTLQSTL